MNKSELNRLVAWRLKLLREADEMPRGVAQTCRHYGLSRNTFYKWKAQGTRVTVRPVLTIEPELQCDRPTPPLALSFPRSSTCERGTDLKAGRIASYLHRFHDIHVARSTAHRILIRYGMGRLPANQKRRPTGRPGIATRNHNPATACKLT